MKNLVLFGLLVLFLIAAQFATGQTVDQIINKYIDARGGQNRLDSIKSIYMEGSREMMGNELTVKVTKEQSKLSRTEFEMGAGNGYILVTDKGAWNYFPMRSTEPEKLSPDAAKSMQTDLDIEGPLVNYESKGHTVSLLGKDTLNDEDCYKIKLTTKNHNEIYYWIDCKTYLLVQSSQMTNGGVSGLSKGPGELVTLYKDYGMVDGILFPHTIELKMPGSNNHNSGGTTFDKIELNVPVNAELFKPTQD
jgi:outer membrane lipoprotein-sorting protein